MALRTRLFPFAIAVTTAGCVPAEYQQDLDWSAGKFARTPAILPTADLIAPFSDGLDPSGTGTPPPAATSAPSAVAASDPAFDTLSDRTQALLARAETIRARR